MNPLNPMSDLWSGRRVILAVLAVSLLLAGGCFWRPDAGSQETPPPEEQPEPGQSVPPDDGAGGTPGSGQAPPPTPTPLSGCAACHSTPLGKAPQHWSAPDPPPDAVCAICHELTAHTSGTVRLWATPGAPGTVIPVSLQLRSDPAEQQKLTSFCGYCHSSATQGIHATGHSWQPTCTACHDVHDPTSANLSHVAKLVRNVTLGADKAVVFTARTGPGSFNDGVGAEDGICQVCHTATRFHRHDGFGTAHRPGADCTACHTHARGFIPPSGNFCIDCHSAAQGPRPAIVRPDGSGGHHLATEKLTNEDCLKCHEMSQHQAGTVRLWQNPNQPTTALAVSGDPNQLVTFCESCHSGANHPTVHKTGAPWNPACTQCHEMHDPANANRALVANVIRNQTLNTDKSVVFTARSGAGSFSDGVGAHDGVCHVCHTATRHHQQNGSGTAHHEGGDCTTCHAHASGFIPAGGTSCIGCHVTVQGARRAVVSEFGLASHHVQGVAINDADCLICHDTGYHPGPQVRLRNVDKPAEITTLTGNPLSSFAEAQKLETFCLRCHDADAAGGAPPFSNGRMPRKIDEALWRDGSHRAGQTTCLGDGETFGCHSTGHGSVKRKLLAPWEGKQQGIPGDPLRQEEGLCYSCHDADGPAGSDIQAQFARATHHKVSAEEQKDGSKVECTNCHDPHKANGGAPLINPDSGAPWTGTGEAFCLTCHDGVPPQDVKFPPASTGTGFDKSKFVGTTHDVETGSSSCRHCHYSHGSSELALLRAKYVVTDYTSYAFGDGKYAICWMCHYEDKIMRQNNAFESLHSEHVKSQKAPCLVCHDVHAGFDAGEPGLINFDYSVGSQRYQIEFIGGKNGSTAFYLNEPQKTRGYCYIKCHSQTHEPEVYTRAKVATTYCFVCH